jgi:hypothetical protein
MRVSTLTRLAQWGFIAFLLALAQFRMILLLMGNQYYASVEGANGVVHGTPYWIVFQNRVLAPYTIALLSGLVGQFQLAHKIFTVFTIAIAGYLILAVSWRLFGSARSWGVFFLFQMLLCLVWHKDWLYAWDLYDIIILILFAYFVFSGKDWRWFTALFAVGIFNRDSALFVSVWMILDPLAKALLDRGRGIICPPDWRMFIAGIITMAAGLGIVNGLRSILLVGETGPELFHLPEKAGKSIQYMLPENLEFLRHVFVESSKLHWESGQFVILFFAVVGALALALVLRDPRRYLAFAATQVAMLLGIMMVGLLDETRVLLDSVPFVALGFWALQAKTEVVPMYVPKSQSG